MVKIKIQKWDDLNVTNLAEMTSEVRRLEGLGDYSVEQVETYLRDMNERFPMEIVVLALNGQRIIGWIGMERATENIGELGRWYPFVVHDVNRTKVARSLISEVISYAHTHDIARIEVAFGGISDANQRTYQQRCEWYESKGWKKLEDSYFMSVNPTGFQICEIKLPDEYQTKPLLDADNDALFGVYHESFMTGEARWIRDMTEDERRQEFEKYFDRTRAINGPASFVIENEGELVGFVLVISRSDVEEHVESIGVHPLARGKGLGRYLLTSALDVLRDQSVTNFTLGVDPVNAPAVRLYEKLGFETISRTARYSWKDKDART